MTHHTSPPHLELRVHELAQLFNSMDPTPFHNKAIDQAAEAYIENWARGLPAKTPVHLTIHLKSMPTDGEPSALVTEAIHHHFADKARQVRSDLQDLFWQGRTSLVIGLTFVALCLLAADAIGKWENGTMYTIARESLTIVGWVAMWRPMQIFFYDWWPLARRIRTAKMLSRARIKVIQGK
nr:hypothetical protein [uncultured Rhodoferax sp.]